MTPRHLVTPPAPEEPAPPSAADGSVFSLLTANVLALGVALAFGWDLTELMLIYWAQSIVIGGSYVFRILSLERFSTANFRMNDRPVDPTPETKRSVAAFFVLHFGTFHGAYLVFLVIQGTGSVLANPGFWLCIALFAVNHYWSYRYNLETDRRGTPNIGTMMFTPYVRVVPMHLMIVLGSLVTESAAGLLLFGALKTVADVAMHVIEHRQLGKVRARM